jgi:hypothetical protein
LAAVVRATIVVVVMPPEAPAMTTVALPSVVLLLAFSVSWLDEIAGFLLRDAVTPVGRPVACNVTRPVKPFTGMTLIVSVTLLPGARERLATDSERLNPEAFGERMVTESLVVALMLPDIPLTVMIDVPGFAVGLAFNVRTLAPVAALVLKAAVTPFDRPVALRATVPLNPFAGLTTIVATTVLP